MNSSVFVTGYSHYSMPALGNDARDYKKVSAHSNHPFLHLPLVETTLGFPHSPELSLGGSSTATNPLESGTERCPTTAGETKVTLSVHMQTQFEKRLSDTQLRWCYRTKGIFITLKSLKTSNMAPRDRTYVGNTHTQSSNPRVGQSNSTV